MSGTAVFYICPVCFETSTQQRLDHEHGPMQKCEPGPPGSERRKPVKDHWGEYICTAPRWYLEAAGWMERYPHTV